MSPVAHLIGRTSRVAPPEAVVYRLLIKFHDLRATFITQMLIRGVAIAKVMKIVGHANIKTTMRYLRLVAQDTQGATESLGITLPKDFNNDNVVNLFQR